jgi:membrane protease subunit (stomatin/prohibitin family)
MKLIDVIKYEGDNNTFIWKHPSEDFNIFTQLVVHENQEALFYYNGEALDLFGPGRYTLKTQNIPLLKEVLKLGTGGISPFHCEVYFINKTEQLGMKWGTDSRVQYIDPTYNFPLSVGACGEYSIYVADSRELLVKLVGTQKVFNQQDLNDRFRAFMMTRVKTYMGQIMKAQKISIFELDEKLTLFSDEIKKLLIPDFDDYGLSLQKFLVTKVMRPEDDPQYIKFKELYFRQYADIAEAKIRQQTEVINAETEAQKTIIGSKAQATKRMQEGYTYGQERGFNVAEKVAENEAVGEFTNMGVGLGTMAGVGGAVGGMVGGVMNGAMDSVTKPVPAQAAGYCVNCGAKLTEGVAFCEECGTPVAIKATACKKCGYVFERPGKFCPKCGARRE